MCVFAAPHATDKPGRFWQCVNKWSAILRGSEARYSASGELQARVTLWWRRREGTQTLSQKHERRIKRKGNWKRKKKKKEEIREREKKIDKKKKITIRMKG